MPVAKKKMELPSQEEVRGWSVDEVQQQLIKMGLEDCCDIMKTKQVDGISLLGLNDAILQMWSREMKIMQIKKISKLVHNLNNLNSAAGSTAGIKRGKASNSTTRYSHIVPHYTKRNETPRGTPPKTSTAPKVSNSPRTITSLKTNTSPKTSTSPINSTPPRNTTSPRNSTSSSTSKPPRNNTSPKTSASPSKSTSPRNSSSPRTSTSLCNNTSPRQTNSTSTSLWNNTPPRQTTSTPLWNNTPPRQTTSTSQTIEKPPRRPSYVNLDTETQPSSFQTFGKTSYVNLPTNETTVGVDSNKTPVGSPRDEQDRDNLDWDTDFDTDGSSMGDYETMRQHSVLVGKLQNQIVRGPQNRGRSTSISEMKNKFEKKSNESTGDQIEPVNGSKSDTNSEGKIDKTGGAKLDMRKNSKSNSISVIKEKLISKESIPTVATVAKPPFQNPDAWQKTQSSPTLASMSSSPTNTLKGIPEITKPELKFGNKPSDPTQAEKASSPKSVSELKSTYSKSSSRPASAKTSSSPVSAKSSSGSDSSLQSKPSWTIKMDRPNTKKTPESTKPPTNGSDQLQQDDMVLGRQSALQSQGSSGAKFRVAGQVARKAVSVGKNAGNSVVAENIGVSSGLRPLPSTPPQTNPSSGNSSRASPRPSPRNSPPSQRKIPGQSADQRSTGKTSSRKTEAKKSSADDMLDIGRFEWYQPVDRRRAEELVKQLGMNGAFIIRDSKHGGADCPFTLTILFNRKVFNVPIRIRPDGMFALGKSKRDEMIFESVERIVKHHKVEPLKLTAGTDGSDMGRTTFAISPAKTIKKIHSN